MHEVHNKLDFFFSNCHYKFDRVKEFFVIANNICLWRSLRYIPQPWTETRDACLQKLRKKKVMSLLNYDSKIRFRTEFNIHNVFIQTPCQKPRDAKSKHRQKCLRYWNNVARSHFPFSRLVLKLAQALSK